VYKITAEELNQALAHKLRTWHRISHHYSQTTELFSEYLVIRRPYAS